MSKSKNLMQNVIILKPQPPKPKEEKPTPPKSKPEATIVKQSTAADKKING